MSVVGRNVRSYNGVLSRYSPQRKWSVLFHWKSTPLLPSTGGAPLLRRVPIVVLLALLTVSLLGPVQSGWVESELSADPPVADTTAPSDRYFPETGFSVTDAAIW